MTNQIIESGTCDHCLTQNVSVTFMNQAALRAHICLNCLAAAANLLYRSSSNHGQQSGEWIVSDVVSARTGQPRIDIQSPSMDAPVQMSVKEALGFALVIFQVAEAAKLNASLNEWMKEAGFDDSQRASMLYEVRKHREKNNDYE